MGLRDELRQKFFTRKKRSGPNNDIHSQGNQDGQATKAPNTSNEHTGFKHIEPKQPVGLNLADTPIHELWNLAYEKLRQEDTKLIQEYESKIQEDLTAGFSLILAPNINARERMEIVLRNKMDKVKRDAWRLKFGNSDIQISAILPIFSSIASRANEHISNALTANPPASLAWGGISVLLPLLLNLSEQDKSLAKGLDYISTLIVRGRLREDLYVRRYELEVDNRQSSALDHLAYKGALEALYRKILKFQAETYCHLTQNFAHRLGLDAVKWNDWEAMIDDVRLQEDALSGLDKLWHDVQYSHDSLEAKKQHEKSLATWITVSEDVSGLRKALEEAAKDHDRKEFLSWLCQVDPSHMYNAARDRHEAGTTGSGKSILSSSVIKHIDDKYASDPLIAMSYFYFSFADSQKQKVDVMLASIIKQILAHRPNIPPSAQKLSEYKVSGRRPDTQTLITALKDSILGFSAVYIIIDALDECPTLSGERKKLIKALHDILDKAPENLHLLFTSRKESDISSAMRRHLSHFSSYELDLLAYRHIVDDDIGLFIDSILATDDYESWPASVKAEARKSLVEKADGMFQYVRCQFDTLHNLSTVAEIREALQSLPDGLSATYDRMLLSISPNFQPRVMNSLKWLAFSLKPIEVDWLSEIFTFRPDNTISPDGTEKLFRASDVVKYFSSLVVVADRKVRLAHFSIKEYLTSTKITDGPAAAFGFTEIDAHLHIAHSCLAYHLLHADDIKDEPQFRNKPEVLYSYTSRQWAWHLEMIPSTLWPPEVVQKAVSALNARSKTLAKMISFGPWHFVDATLFLARPLCYTAWLGLPSLTMMLLSHGPGTNNFFTQEDLDMALQHAAYKGDFEMVWGLVDEGANINGEGSIVKAEHARRKIYDAREYCFALQAAALGGHLEIVKLLINKGAEINAICEECGSALHAAAKGNHLDVIKFLVGHGADIYARSRMGGSVLASSVQDSQDQCFNFLLSKGALKKDDGETALLKAASLHRWDLCYLMLDNGASVNAFAPNNFGSPLQAACRDLWVAITKSQLTKLIEFIERLLDLGADINAQGGEAGNVLQSACRLNNISVVKMLLDKGADVNALDRQNRNALQASLYAFGDRLELMKLLLSRGANVNAQSHYGNALQLACTRLCSKDEVSLLLEHGVDMYAKGGEFGTALQAAVAYGHEWLVRELLERGADVNELGGHYETALQAAYSRIDSRLAQVMVKLLLDHGADVHPKGGAFGSALNAAAANIGLPNSAIQQLLDLGVDINDYDQRHGTALQATLRFYYDGIEGTKLLERLKFLFECGADANIEAGPFGFALQSAIMANHRGLGIPLCENIGLVFLLENCLDININAEGGEFGSALQAAAFSGQTESVKLLIEKGANVNIQGGEYKNALNAATVWGYWDIAKILLENGAEPDCYRSESPDEEWLNRMVERCGRGARERYKKIWEMKNPKLDITNEAL
ncbi:hypothetical protein FP744_10005849 [Trichoderma asperellum]